MLTINDESSTNMRNKIWYPFTQHTNMQIPIKIERGEGAYLYSDCGKKYLDMISSWWVNIHGHSHPEIAKAIYDQALKLEHVIFSGFTHEPAQKLAESLISILPKNLNKIFFSDNGSTAVEVALKIAYQYWKNNGEVKRTQFLAFQGGYHGDTFGAMSVGKKSQFFKQFEDLLFSVKHFAYPETWNDQDSVEKVEQQVLSEINTYLEQNHHTIAAIILEPMVQGASGMRMCRPQFLIHLEKLLRHYNILIIYDEVMTGFGRTGELFASIKSKTQPDIICLAKGLTGGFLPLAITACSDKIFSAFLGDSFNQALAHGHSFTANPLGCAAALASLRILQQKQTIDQLNLIEMVHSQYLPVLQKLPLVEKIRLCGTISAFNVCTKDAYGSQFSLKLRKFFLEVGLLIRPLGNVIYLMPPYCISEKDLHECYEKLIRCLQTIKV